MKNPTHAARKADPIVILPYDKKHLIATLKYFATYGQPESGTNCAQVNVSMRVLHK